MASFHLCCVLGVICCLLSVVNTLWDKRGAVKVERRDSHRLYPPRNFPENLSYAFLCHFATDKFVSALDMAVQQLNTYHRPLLVHTRDERSDVLLYVGEDAKNFTVPISAPRYSNLQAVSHIPVTAAAIALPDVLLNSSNSTFVNDTLQRFTELQHVLEQTSTLIQSGTFEPGNQSTRQTEIVEATSQFISAALQNTISMEMVGNFVQSVDTQLMANARDAVRDYLTCLNETITTLLVQGNISSSEWQKLSVVVALQPFAVPRSFIVQYYEQLLNVRYNVSRSNPERIVLLSLPRQPQSTSTVTSSITAVSTATLMHNLSRTFYNPSNPYTPIHQILSNAASEIICSAELYFLSCTAGQENQLPPGFETMVERVYVIIIIFTNTAAIVLAIVVLCICSEDRKMKGELKRTLRKYEGPNLFTPVDKKRKSDAVNSQTTQDMDLETHSPRH